MNTDDIQERLHSIERDLSELNTSLSALNSLFVSISDKLVECKGKLVTLASLLEIGSSSSIIRPNSVSSKEQFGVM